MEHLKRTLRLYPRVSGLMEYAHLVFELENLILHYMSCKFEVELDFQFKAPRQLEPVERPLKKVGIEIDVCSSEFNLCQNLINFTDYC